jgi:ABC-type uncharacterized transport system substrate-binding protein
MSSTAYQQFVTQLTRTLQAENPLSIATTTLSADQVEAAPRSPDDAPYDLVIALGVRAAQALQHWGAREPILYALLPRATYARLQQSGRLACPAQQCSAVYIDQPLDRQFDILGAAFGDRRRLGVLLGPTSVQLQGTLTDLAARHDFTLHVERINAQEELMPALDRLLEQSNLLLAIADPLVSNSYTAKSLLLSTYRYRVPVMAYSKAYTDAGATLSVYSTPAQAAGQAARMIGSFLRDRRRGLPSPQYPEHYSIHINPRVADSLDLDLGNNPALQSLIKDGADE